MKPNFALNLTQDGVSLYHRSASGAWIEVGTVNMEAGPDDPGVKSDLAFLRKTALGLAQGTGLSSKIVLPVSVVSYLSVHTSGSDAEKSVQIAAELEQRFGIPAAELAFDWIDTAGVSQVAVAERVTLEEAELFAVENRLNPVAIVAAPEPGYFSGEPMFRKTDFAAQLLGPDAEVDRDDLPFFPTAPEAVPQTEAAAAAGLANGAAGLVLGEPTGPDQSEPDQDVDGEPRDAIKVEEAADPAPIAQDPPIEQPETVAPEKADLDTPAPEIEETVALAAFASHRTDDGPVDLGTGDERPIDAIEPRFAAIPVAGDPTDMDLPRPGLGEDTGGTARKRYDLRKTADGVLAGLGTKAAALAGAGAALANRVRARRKSDAATIGAAPPNQTPPDALAASSRGAPANDVLSPENRRRASLAAALLALIAFGSAAAWYLSPPLSDPLPMTSPERLPNPPVEAASLTQTDGDGAASDTPLADIDTAQTGDGLIDPDQRPRRRPDEIMPDTVTPTTNLTDEERAAIVAAGLPLPGADIDEPEMTQTQGEIDAVYTTTGIQSDVVLPTPPGFDEAGEDVFIPQNDPLFAGQDAIALPDYTQGSGDLQPAQRRNPVGPGVAFDVDENGFVRPTTDGALTPEGATVVAGRPSIVPPTRPAPPEGVETGEATPTPEPVNPLAGFRPRHRPSAQDLEGSTTFGTLTREQLAQARPRARPNSPQALAAAAVAAGESPYAIVASAPPSHRPEGFSEAVAKFLAERQNQQASAARRPQQQGNQNAPALPSSANVAEQATIKNAINLGRLNVIGVYGSSSSRRALLRLPSGRYVKVEAGDRVDGGRVASISTNSINYVKGGRAQVLEVPN